MAEHGFVRIETLDGQETDRARQLAERIAASPFTSDTVPMNHLPEAEAMVLATRPELRIIRLLVEERPARQIAAEESIPLRTSSDRGRLPDVRGGMVMNDIREVPESETLSPQNARADFVSLKRALAGDSGHI